MDVDVDVDNLDGCVDVDADNSDECMDIDSDTFKVYIS